MVPSKRFKQDYMTMDCKDGSKLDGFTFPHLLSPTASSTTKGTCDYVIDDTVLLFSHDNIRNAAHTLNDIMNVWTMLWLDGKARNSKSIPFLTIDALKQYNNFDDLINQYYTPYKKNFHSILRGQDYAQSGSTLCLQRVLIQPLPARGFVWDNWHKDLPCSFVGPSSLYQRWNIHLRNSFGLIDSLRTAGAQERIKIVLIVRTESKNDWGSYRTSRLFLNQPEIEKSLRELQASLKSSSLAFELTIQNFALLSFDEQLKLLSETSILIGMHGAGISQSQYMSIGRKNCCGVLEMFPTGEFTPVRGFANMIRKMGLHYERIDISPQGSQSSGAVVPTSEMIEKVRLLLNRIRDKPTCVLEHVVSNPYLEFMTESS